MRDVMLPKVIMHNSMSVDGSLTGFEANLAIHYQLAGRYQADVHLVGSNTAKTGVEMFLETVPPEEEADFARPELLPDDTRPFWVIPDTRGILKGLLHVYRRFEYCKDVIVLISETTPKEYLTYLQARNYDYYVVGDDHVNYKDALEMLAERYNVQTVLTDTGGTLNSILLEQGLINEISLLISPVLVGEAGLNLLGSLQRRVELRLLKTEVFEDHYLWLVYAVLR